MNRKCVCSILMTGVMTLGIVLSSGVSAYAAPEDWFRFDIESNGNQQPTIQIIGEPLWGISYGYTLHSDYKYVPLASIGADNSAPAASVNPAPTVEVSVPTIDAAETQGNPALDMTTAPSAQPSANSVGSDSVTEVAKEILKGKWGVGKERRVKLEAAGYDYKEVQRKVYELMK